MMTQSIRQMAALLGMALLPALISAGIQWDNLKAATEPGDEISYETALGFGEKVLWIDARPSASYAAGHIDGALSLNEDHWQELVAGFIDEWDDDRMIVVYCDGGGCDASHAVAKRLREEVGVKNVHVLKGGWKALPK